MQFYIPCILVKVAGCNQTVTLSHFTVSQMRRPGRVMMGVVGKEEGSEP